MRAVLIFQKVPEELRDDPEHVELYLNGGTVTKEVWVHDRGRAGGHYETVEYEMRDRDWSHDVSKANGGSNEASNGRFEEASDNRSRGARNTTEAEKVEASEEDAEDVRTILGDAEEVADWAILGEAIEVAGGVAEISMEMLAPIVGGGMAAKAVADRCDSTVDKVGWGSLAGGGTAFFLTTPMGQLCLGGYLVYKLGMVTTCGSVVSPNNSPANAGLFYFTTIGLCVYIALVENQLDIVNNEQAGLLAALLALRTGHHQMFIPAHKLPSATPTTSVVSDIIASANLPDTSTLSASNNSLGSTAEYLNKLVFMLNIILKPIVRSLLMS